MPKPHKFVSTSTSPCVPPPQTQPPPSHLLQPRTQPPHTPHDPRAPPPASHPRAPLMTRCLGSRAPPKPSARAPARRPPERPRASRPHVAVVSRIPLVLSKRYAYVRRALRL
eukprot:5336355-Prymnesium_polylepis.1